LVWQKKNCFRRIKSSSWCGGQTHGWILLKKPLYYISFYSTFCRLSPFHREWLPITKIIMIWTFPQKANQNLSRLWPILAIHGGKDLTCNKSSKNYYNKFFFLRGSIHAFGLQIDLKLIFSEESVLKKVSKKILSNHLSNFLHTLISRIFSMLFKIDKYKIFSVKSSWEVHWIVMLQKDAVCGGCILHVYRLGDTEFFRL